MKHPKTTGWLVLALICASNLGCEFFGGQSPVNHSGSAELPEQLQKLTAVNIPWSERRGIMFQLKEDPDARFIHALVRMLPGEWDVQTEEIVVTLGDIGDDTALPKLLIMYNEKIVMMGRLRSQILIAITRIEKGKKDGKINQTVTKEEVFSKGQSLNFEQ